MTDPGRVLHLLWDPSRGPGLLSANVRGLYPAGRGTTIVLPLRGKARRFILTLMPPTPLFMANAETDVSLTINSNSERTMSESCSRVARDTGVSLAVRAGQSRTGSLGDCFFAFTPCNDTIG